MELYESRKLQNQRITESEQSIKYNNQAPFGRCENVKRNEENAEMSSSSRFRCSHSRTLTCEQASG